MLGGHTTPPTGLLIDSGPMIHPHSRKSPHLQTASLSDTPLDNMPSHGHSPKQKQKRIIMNPPAQFIASALAAQPPRDEMVNQLINANGNGALMIAQNGQAVMQPQSQLQAQAQGSAAESSMTTTETDNNAQASTQPSNNSGNAVSDTPGQGQNQNQLGEEVLSGSSVVVQQDPIVTSGATALPLTATSAADTAAVTPTSILPLTTDGPASSTSAINADSAVTTTTTTTAGAASTASTEIASSTVANTSGTGTSTSTASLTSPISATSASASVRTSISSSASLPSTFTATTLPATATATPSASGEHQAPSAGIIFVIILACLVVFAIIASSLSFLFRSRRLGRRLRLRLPCINRNRDDDDDDGLSDLVRSFESPLSRHGSLRGAHARQMDMGEYGHGVGTGGTSSEYRYASGVGLGLGLASSHVASMHPHDPQAEADAVALQRRSSLFAHDPSASPFLHSATMACNPSNGFSLPLPPPIAQGQSEIAPTIYPFPNVYTSGRGTGRGGAPSIAPLPGHLMGEIGPLEVRNGMPAEEDDGVEGLHDIGLDSSSPRFMGLDGNGLETPWSRTLPPRPDEIDEQNPSQGHLTLPPAMTTRNTSQPPYGTFASPAPSVQEDIPQRSATWASNLRSTLFAAISAVKPPVPGSGSDEGQQGEADDRFTRTVGMVYRASTKRRGGRYAGESGPDVDVEKAQGSGGFPIVIEEKDDLQLDQQRRQRPAAPKEAATTTIGSVFLTRLGSTSSDDTLAMPPRSAADRYKHYYARSKSSLALSSSTSETGELGDGDESVAGVRRPPALAGGARAKGARTGSFVVA